LPFPDEWLRFLRESYRTRYFSNGGPCVRQFEAELTERYGQGREAIVTASATAGLTAALLAAPIYRRGSVILPAFTFPATANAILAAGHSLRFCDVSPETWELDPDALADTIRTLTDRQCPPVAIVHVRAFGLCRDLTPIEEIAAYYNLPLIVDAAAAMGGRLPEDRFVGDQGHLEVFSLHATKPFGVGEGGVIFAPPERAALIRRTLNFGLANGHPVINGINGKMSEFHAAIGLAMLQCFPQHRKRRAKIAYRYRAAFTPPPGEYGKPPWQTYPTLVEDAAAAVAHFSAADIEVRRYYRPALHRSVYFESNAPCPTAEYLAEHMICLPIYSDMTTPEQARVIEAGGNCPGIPAEPEEAHA